MAQLATASNWPDGFISDAACALSAIEEIHAAAPALVDQPLDPAAQARMRRALESGRVESATAAANRIVQLHPIRDGI